MIFIAARGEVKRISEVIRDMEDGKVTVSSGHYHSLAELAAAILEHVSTLQKLAAPFSSIGRSSLM